MTCILATLYAKHVLPEVLIGWKGAVHFAPANLRLRHLRPDFFGCAYFRVGVILEWPSFQSK